jgi:hypothetical protein
MSLLLCVSACIPAWSEKLNETPRLSWVPHGCCHDRPHIILSAASIRRRCQESAKGGAKKAP